MKTFFILFGITFIMILISAGLVNIAKTRKRKNNKLGACHTGGTSCSSCSSASNGGGSTDAEPKKCRASATD